MKSKNIVLIPALAMLLSSCSFVTKLISGFTNNGSSSQEQSTTSFLTTSDDGTAPSITVADQHATTCSFTYPKKDTYMQIGQEETFKFSISPTPTQEDEKPIMWSTSNPNILHLEVNANKTSECVVRALKEGEATVTATNIFNRDLTKTLKIKVLTNNQYVYLWSFENEEKGKDIFGYVKDTAPNGSQSGTVTLGNLEWEYSRDYTNALKTYSGAIVFGDGTHGSDGNVTFVNHNERQVSQIIVNCSSKQSSTNYGNGSSTLSIKIGDDYYIKDYVTPAFKTAENTGEVTGNALAKPLTGDIRLEFSPSEGSLYIKSIIIIYCHDLKNISLAGNSIQQTTFFEGESFNYNGLKVNASYVNDDTIYDVTDGVVVSAPKLVLGEENAVTVSYSDGAITKTLTYNVSYRKTATITGAVVTGELEHASYVVGDPITYNGLQLAVTWSDGKVDYKNLPTRETDEFTELNIPAYAEKSMTNGFNYSFKYRGTLVQGTVAAGVFDIVNMRVTFDFGLYSYKTWSTKYEAREFIDETGKVKITLPKARKGTKDTLDVDTDFKTPQVKNQIKISFTELGQGCRFVSGKFEFNQWVGNRGTLDSTKVEKPKAHNLYLNESFFGEEPYQIAYNGQTVVSASTSEDEKVDRFSMECSSLSYGVTSLMINLVKDNDMGVQSKDTDAVGIRKFTLEIDSLDNPAEVESLRFTGTPLYKEYSYGEDFNTYGINVYAIPTRTDLYPEVNVTNQVRWNTLEVGQTSVVGTYKGKSIEVSGIEVINYDPYSYQKVTSIDDVSDGTYLITAEDKHVVFNGGLTTTKVIDKNNTVHNERIFGSNTIVGTLIVDKCYFTITKVTTEENKFLFKTSLSGSEGYLGLVSDASSSSTGSFKCTKPSDFNSYEDTKKAGYYNSIEFLKDDEGNLTGDVDIIATYLVKDKDGETKDKKLCYYAETDKVNYYADAYYKKSAHLQIYKRIIA